jgi:hypothetical protein
MTKHDTIQVSVRLPSELVSAIDTIARDECRTRSSQIEYLLNTSVESPPARRREPMSHQESAS